jgi:hypothetical protein
LLTPDGVLLEARGAGVIPEGLVDAVVKACEDSFAIEYSSKAVEGLPVLDEALVELPEFDKLELCVEAGLADEIELASGVALVTVPEFVGDPEPMVVLEVVDEAEPVSVLELVGDPEPADAHEVVDKAKLLDEAELPDEEVDIPDRAEMVDEVKLGDEASLPVEMKLITNPELLDRSTELERTVADVLTVLLGFVDEALAVPSSNTVAFPVPSCWKENCAPFMSTCCV